MPRSATLIISDGIFTQLLKTQEVTLLPEFLPFLYLTVEHFSESKISQNDLSAKHAKIGAPFERKRRD